MSIAKIAKQIQAEGIQSYRNEIEGIARSEGSLALVLVLLDLLEEAKRINSNLSDIESSLGWLQASQR